MTRTAQAGGDSWGAGEETARAHVEQLLASAPHTPWYCRQSLGPRPETRAEAESQKVLGGLLAPVPPFLQKTRPGGGSRAVQGHKAGPCGLGRGSQHGCGGLWPISSLGWGFTPQPPAEPLKSTFLALPLCLVVRGPGVTPVEDLRSCVFSLYKPQSSHHLTYWVQASRAMALRGTARPAGPLSRTILLSCGFPQAVRLLPHITARHCWPSGFAVTALASAAWGRGCGWIFTVSPEPWTVPGS